MVDIDRRYARSDVIVGSDGPSLIWKYSSGCRFLSSGIVLPSFVEQLLGECCEHCFLGFCLGEAAGELVVVEDSFDPVREVVVVLADVVLEHVIIHVW